MPGVTTCRACERRIPENEPAAICKLGFYHHIDCMPAQVLEVIARLQSPLRAPVGQHDAGHLPLFIAANEPALL